MLLLPTMLAISHAHVTLDMNEGNRLSCTGLWFMNVDKVLVSIAHIIKNEVHVGMSTFACIVM